MRRHRRLAAEQESAGKGTRSDVNNREGGWIGGGSGSCGGSEGDSISPSVSHSNISNLPSC
jgi:hypothetical protein